ncbi:MAG: SagB/ThcOx family dehydrogenase [Dehalococcoidales bacterium]|nr:SagB/ThcOx family dehydrogenase [Dehalococcoidales bacterium]
MGSNIGDRFQQETKYTRDNVAFLRTPADIVNRPPISKKYADKPRITLPPPQAGELLSLDQALRKRKSTRQYANKPITLDQLSYLIWATTGIQRTEGEFRFRTAPSAGRTYPIETYLVVNNISGIPQGLYHYAIVAHALETMKEGDFSNEVKRAAMAQKICAESPVVFLWTAIFQRVKYRYHEHSYRYVYLDAGHIAQNLALTATAMGLATCQIGAFFDNEVNTFIGVDGIEESIVYMSVTGWQA